jgi:hypothetical protein
MLPYIDQRGEFWADLSARHPGMIGGVYFPLSVPGIGSGRPAQPARYLAEFLKQEAVGKSALVNAPVLPPPARASRSTILDALCRLAEEYGLAGATLCDIILAEMVRKRLPELELTASTLMEIAEPNQAVMLEGLFHVLVPATRVLRSPAKLEEIRAAFPGRIRLLVNEGCLPGCPYRRQHFHEMAYATDAPESLCQGLLDRRPWLRLTGAWVLPQHLHWYDGLADQYKLAGRVTLQRPEDYLRVCGAYIARTALWPHQIGAGPASVLGRLAVTDEFFEKLMACRMQCHECDLCSRVAQGMESQ